MGILSAPFGVQAQFVPVTISGTSTGKVIGGNGVTYSPGATIDGPLQFEDTSSQIQGDLGYYGIGSDFSSGSFGNVSLVAPVAGSGKTVKYNDTLVIDVTFVSPTNTSQDFQASVVGSLTGSIVASGKTKGSKATGGVTVSFGPTPLKFYYGPQDKDWFTLQLNSVSFGPSGGTESITGYGETYAIPVTPEPVTTLLAVAGVGVFLRRKLAAA